MYLDTDGIILEPDDQCFRCQQIDACPLVEALLSGIVLMGSEDFRVKNCGLYDGPAPLRLVK